MQHFAQITWKHLLANVHRRNAEEQLPARITYKPLLNRMDHMCLIMLKQNDTTWQMERTN